MAVNEAKLSDGDVKVRLIAIGFPNWLTCRPSNWSNIALSLETFDVLSVPLKAAANYQPPPLFIPYLSLLFSPFIHIAYCILHVACCISFICWRALLHLLCLLLLAHLQIDSLIIVTFTRCYYCPHVHSYSNSLE